MHMFNRCVERFFPDAYVDRIYLTTINHKFSAAEAREILPGPGVSFAKALRGMLNSKISVIRELVEAVKAADLVVINGEGSILEDQPNARMIYMTAELAHHFGTEPHLINFTAHITRSNSIELAAHAFHRFVTVSVREPLSYYTVRSFFPRVHLFPDIVAGLDVHAAEPTADCDYVLIGGGSATLRMVNKPGSMERLKAALKSVCDELKKSGHQVRLMGWFRDEWLRDIAEEDVRYHTVDFARYLGFCRGALVNFTGRHHGCVMSSAAGCPFITTTANCFKNFGDRVLYGRCGSAFELERLNGLDLADELKACVRHREYHAEAIRLRMEVLRPYFFGAFANIRQRVNDLVEDGIIPFDARPSDLHYVQHMTP